MGSKEIETVNKPQTSKSSHALCKLCGAEARYIGCKTGSFTNRRFEVYRCPDCRFIFVANPWLDFEEIYSERYYRGQGADPLVDYLYELEHPADTVRQYEWAGILKIVQSCVDINASTSWLDFGCGNGGLVRYIRQHKPCRIAGFEEGWIAAQAKKLAIPILSREELDGLRGSCDIVTAIEVLEHLPDPLPELKKIRSLLKPGGLFFYTTGNAAPHAAKILGWPYLLPELHVSLYEPTTLARALEAAGFRTEFRRFLPGFDQVIRFKILKGLQVRRTARWEKALPWGVIARGADARLQVTAHPIGWAT